MVRLFGKKKKKKTSDVMFQNSKSWGQSAFLEVAQWNQTRVKYNLPVSRPVRFPRKSSSHKWKHTGQHSVCQNYYKALLLYWLYQIFTIILSNALILNWTKNLSNVTEIIADVCIFFYQLVIYDFLSNLWEATKAPLLQICSCVALCSNVA